MAPPLIMVAPPSPASRIVTALMLTLIKLALALSISRIRLPVLLALIVRLSTPGPVMVKLSEIVIWPEVRVIVPLIPAINSIASAPLLPFASEMALRKLPSPASLRLLTVNVAKRARTSSGSTTPGRGRKDLRGQQPTTTFPSQSRISSRSTIEKASVVPSNSEEIRRIRGFESQESTIP